MPVLLHNPRCSKSREALNLLREHGIEPQIRLYLDDALSIDELSDLLRKLGSGARQILRTGEQEYADLHLDDPELTEEQLIAAMHAHPRLIERPILIAGSRAVLGRPPERVLESTTW